VSKLRYGLDEFCSGSLAERFSKQRNILREVVFLDKAAFPDLGKHPFLAQNASAIFDKHQQRIERLRRELDRTFAVEQQPLAAIETEGAECVDSGSFVGHRSVSE